LAILFLFKINIFQWEKNMKLLKLPVKITLILSWVFISTNSAHAQSGNFSDITGPNPQEVTPVTETSPTDVTETPTETSPTDVTETPTETSPTDVTETPTDSGSTDVTETPTETSPTDVTETPTDSGSTDVTETPTDSGSTDVTETPTETSPTDVTETPTDSGSTDVTETPTDSGSTDVTETPTDSGSTDVTETPTDSGSTDVTETPTDSGSTGETETPTDSGSTGETETPTDSGSTGETETVTDSGSTGTDSQPKNESTVSEDSQPTESEVVEKPEAATTSEEKTEETTSEESQETEEVAEEEKVTEEKKVAEEEEEEDKVAEEDKQSDFEQEVDRLAYEVQVQQSDTNSAIQLQEEFQATQLINSSGLQIYGTSPSVGEISKRLAELGEQTGKKPAFINISLQSNQLETFVVLPDQPKSAKNGTSIVASTNFEGTEAAATQGLTVRKTVKDTSRENLIATATQFREEVSDSGKLKQKSYMESAQELYKVLIEPIEAELKANNIDILVFSMDSGLRLLPLAALYDGQQFLIEKYAVALVPSFGLTDTRYVNLAKSPILAMGASEFTGQPAIPTMQTELESIVRNPRLGEMFFNEQFTVSNFKAQNSRSTPFPIIHLGTHAEFKAGNLDDSYIQFYDSQMKMPELREISNELGWNNSETTPVELLVLSACETALGNEKAELGFAGLAVQAGVKSALASLWRVSDLGTLALMGEFYDQLGDTLIKAEALRQTQLGMLRGNVKIDNGQVDLSNGDFLTLPAEFPNGTLTFSHPYFWSAFTMIGNWN
jgi:CHAT domain-containing protein